MIYTCQHCGAWFPADSIRNAMHNNETIITCKFCNKVTEFRQMKASHIAKGYDHLSVGDFYLATMEFNNAIEDSLAHGKTPSPDAYFGYALAQFRVQTIFSEEDPNRLNVPQLLCQRCNEMDFADSNYYVKALQALEVSADKNNFGTELVKLKECQKTIDTIKDYYNAIAKSKPVDFSYGAFIAYEDKPQDGLANRGYEFAHKVRNALPDEIKNVFLPDIDEYENDLHYEAAILYALEHSKCMLVITDDNIDSRLTNLYSRFYLNEYGGGNTGASGKNLGFVRYCGHITIALPDKTVAVNNVFDIEDKTGFVRFACLRNNIIMQGMSTNEIVEQEETIEIDVEDVEHFGGKTYEILPGRMLSFGHYPQKRDASEQVKDFFTQFGKPTPSDSKGWTVMFVSKKGNPYTWYRDEEFNGKKYRAVYFTKFRDAYSVQDSNASVTTQKSHGYMPMRIYCFTFDPIIWDIEDMSRDTAIVVANMGIDSREYNSECMDNEWQHSTMHEWLNEEFIHTAFGEEEINCLCSIAGDEHDKVFLMDKTFDKPYYSNRHTAIFGSDYFKCIGGMGDRSINSYWITDNNIRHGQEAAIIHPDTHYSLDTTYVDSTLVAVLPKVIVKLS